jgi:hypothetical protein
MSEKMKRCAKCGELKACTDFYKNKSKNDDKSKNDGLSALCKHCDRVASKRYREENRDKLREIVRRWREENREKVIERGLRYREENRERLQDNNRRYYEKNREKILEKNRRYNKENKDRINLVVREKRRSIKSLNLIGSL